MPSAPNPHLVLSEATLSDASAIAPLFFRSFHDQPYFRAMMPKTPACVESWKTATKIALDDPYTRVLKVTDEKTGEIVSSGRWIFPREELDTHQPGEEEDRWGDLPEQCDEELANALFGAFAENRRGFMGDRRHYCALCPLSHLISQVCQRFRY